MSNQVQLIDVMSRVLLDRFDELQDARMSFWKQAIDAFVVSNKSIQEKQNQDKDLDQSDLDTSPTGCWFDSQQACHPLHSRSSTQDRTVSSKSLQNISKIATTPSAT